MASIKNVQELKTHKNESLKKLDELHNHFIKKGDHKKSDLISYWIKDYVKFLRIEESFKPSNLKKYKRGEIIKVSLGYRIGSEQGGLHYAVVLDKSNSIHSPVVTIIPLSSIKETKVLSSLPKDNIDLGTEIFDKIFAKLTKHVDSVEEEKLSIETKQNEIKEILDLKLSNVAITDDDILKQNAIQLQLSEEILQCSERITKLIKMHDTSIKLKKEILKMKSGSIALVNQITTVSKIRIYDPKKSNDILSNIKLSNEYLNLIDQTIKECYTNS